MLVASKILVVGLALVTMQAGAESIREEATVLIGGQAESWTLKWRDAPSTAVCGPENPLVSLTCPCSGFAYAESGHLTLVRERPWHDPESLSLDDLFLADGAPTDKASESILARWPVLDGDIKRMDGDPTLPKEIRQRQRVRILRFADYDHDGKAAEFLLQVGTWPCGKHYMVAVGTFGAHGSLGPLRTWEHPERPLALPENAWKALLGGGSKSVIEWECDDHTSEFHQVLHVLATAGRVTAERRNYTCPYDSARSAVKVEVL